MNITKQGFVNLNKWVLYVAIPVYLIGLFTPVKYMQPALIFVFGAAFFCLLDASQQTTAIFFLYCNLK